MEIKLAGRVMPRGPGGDVKFTSMDTTHALPGFEHTGTSSLLEVFTKDEIVELVNRAIYQLEYQAASHRKRGQAERDKMKALKAALGKAAAKDAAVKKELKGE